ncbi:methyltransferase domain-containing protein [Geoalkalibacter halelectricus]|uniref:Malonyl-[acyl-carrier protein] O-methyltransferase n=1 Tax=Geoalkalibacter halelectricus TaxID=2847045 RepID=A0ABY5ZQ85_9BACT|nr:methyltransferase domain-containing protein [Geoalkalibacter halelectricus]MDO3379236.1 methyltransferase domain-containing protein [Geoalkalibacter halelectricus]UWZ80994.1 methyltransferase domain-containing protein [Geoalkalibacter halelectricus]
MSAVLVQRVREHFSCHAEEYDRFARVQKIVAARLVAQASPLIPAGRVLDVGTGTGEVARCLRERDPGRPLLVCDLAPGMTRHAVASLPNALAADGDAQSLPFVAGVFAGVLSASVYQWMNDLPEAFREARRVLADEGLFAFALFGEGTLFELRASHRQAVAEMQPGGCSHVQEFPSRQGVAAALEAGGFRILRLWSENEVEWHETVPDLLRALKKIGAQNASDQRPPGLASRRVMQRMNDIYRARFAHEGRIPATYEVIYGLACKGW